jgi:hypothetical protein
MPGGEETYPGVSWPRPHRGSAPIHTHTRRSHSNKSHIRVLCLLTSENVNVGRPKG